MSPSFRMRALRSFCLMAFLMGQGCTTAVSDGDSDDAAPSSCEGDLDCPVGQFCVDAACTTPRGECTADEDCGEGRICEATSCRSGCRDDDQCPGDQICARGRLVCEAPDVTPCDDMCDAGSRCDPDTGRCVPDDDNNDTPCGGDEQCASGQICEGGDCVSGCRMDDDCGDDEICVALNCDAGCRMDDDCGQGAICEDEVCADGCRETADCADGLFCDDGQCVQDNRECAQDTDCGQARICENDACVEGCRDDASCPPAQVCQGGQCEPGCRADSDCGASQTCDDGQCQCQADAFEPNDQVSQAHPLADGAALQGSICSGDADFFALEAAPGCVARVQIIFPHDAGDIDAELLSPDNTTIAAGTSQDDNELVEGVMGPGQHHLRVFSPDGAQNGYQILFDIGECGQGPGADALVLSEVYYDSPGGDDQHEWIEIYNGGDESVDLSGFSLGFAGTAYTYSTAQLSGVIEPRGCVVVGGPVSNPDNGNPTFDISLNFEPDIQNSGSTADAVGLFRGLAVDITADSLPIDAVIYGGSNNSALRDSNGDTPTPNVNDAPSAHSLERTRDGWRIQDAPTPNDCALLR